jgi:acyl-CoA hydrolase
MSVIADVFAEDIASGERRHTNECWLTFVHLDEAGRPTVVPRLILETADDEHMNALAQHRRESLLAEKR